MYSLNVLPKLSYASNQAHKQEFYMSRLYDKGRKWQLSVPQKMQGARPHKNTGNHVYKHNTGKQKHHSCEH
jgi:hypothetical protein